MKIDWDVVVYGATPGGIGTALGAARQGLCALIIEPSSHFGGLMTSGLGKSDVENPQTSGAVFREFTERVVAHYVAAHGADSEQVRACHGGISFEPSVASVVLSDMVRPEPNIEIRFGTSIQEAEITDAAIRSIVIMADETGRRERLTAPCFVDATYEGDLASLAKVPYRVGRESRDEWNEEFAGKIYMAFDQTKEVLPGSTGEGDKRVQAYNYRLCLTNVSSNRIPVSKPAIYDRSDYISLIEDARSGRVKVLDDVIQAHRYIPNGKTDTNHHHFSLCSTDLAEENGGYPEGGREDRARFALRLRHYTEGLLWFLQHDDELPVKLRNEALEWGYAKDEFTDNGHFPPQVYVREARRIVGEYTFTENDARIAPGLRRTPIQPQSVAVGHYQIDSHSTRKRDPIGQNKAVEGFIGLRWLTRAYQIPFGIMMPQSVDGLLVPVAVSATHMGFGTIRMEPVWMQLGFAAGVACSLALANKCRIRDVSISDLQVKLLGENQRISYFSDIVWEHPARKAAEFFATKGFFTSYEADLEGAMTVEEASRLIGFTRSLPRMGRLPSLPASDRVLPAGVDMGPWFPRTEPEPVDYWAANPLLPIHMFRRWFEAAVGAFKMGDSSFGFDTGEVVTRGSFLRCLYLFIEQGTHPCSSACRT